MQLCQRIYPLQILHWQGTVLFVYFVGMASERRDAELIGTQSSEETCFSIFRFLMRYWISTFAPVSSCLSLFISERKAYSWFLISLLVSILQKIPVFLVSFELVLFMKSHLEDSSWKCSNSNTKFNSNTKILILIE